MFWRKTKRIAAAQRMSMLVLAIALAGFNAVQAYAATVQKPPTAPEWWNQECPYYAYGWWEEDFSGKETQTPPDDPNHFASNFLKHTNFSAYIARDKNNNGTVHVSLKNGERSDYYKEIFIRVQGYTNQGGNPYNAGLGTGGQKFKGLKGGGSLPDADYKKWWYELKGEIHHQPEYVHLWFTVPDLNKVTNIWAGENCLAIPDDEDGVPEPASLVLWSSLAATGLIRSRGWKKLGSRHRTGSD